MIDGYHLFKRKDLNAGLTGSAADLQRRHWVIGSNISDQCFAGMFTRRHRGDIEEQDWWHHDADEVEFVVEGRLHVQFAGPDGEIGSEFIAEAGDLFIIKEGTPHRADAVGDALCVGMLFCPKAYDIGLGQPFISEADRREMETG